MNPTTALEGLALQAGTLVVQVTQMRAEIDRLHAENEQLRARLAEKEA